MCDLTDGVQRGGGGDHLQDPGHRSEMLLVGPTHERVEEIIRIHQQRGKTDAGELQLLGVFFQPFIY